MDDGRPAPVWTPAKCGLLCAGKDMYRYRYFTGKYRFTTADSHYGEPPRHLVKI
jgi:hypothetical protein